MLWQRKLVSKGTHPEKTQQMIGPQQYYPGCCFPFQGHGNHYLPLAQNPWYIVFKHSRRWLAAWIARRKRYCRMWHSQGHSTAAKRAAVWPGNRVASVPKDFQMPLGFCMVWPAVEHDSREKFPEATLLFPLQVHLRLRKASEPSWKGKSIIGGGRWGGSKLGWCLMLIHLFHHCEASSKFWRIAPPSYLCPAVHSSATLSSSL